MVPRSSSGTPDSRRRAARFDAYYPAKAGECDIVERHPAAPLPNLVEYRWNSPAHHQIFGGISFGVAADLHDGEALPGQGGRQVGGGGGFSNSAFSVNCNLHDVPPLCIFTVYKDII